MSQVDMLIFDDRSGQWGPMTDLRAVFDLRSGALTNRERIERGTGKRAAALWIAEAALAQLVALTHEQPVNPRQYAGPVLAVNGRWAGVERAEQVAALAVGQALVQSDGQIVAAHLTPGDAQALLPPWGPLGALNDGVQRTVVQARLLMERPWHVLDELEVNLGSDIAAVDLPQLKGGARGTVCFGDHPVYMAQDAVVQPGAVFNTEQGPIVVESKALIGALAVLEGPCYVGPDATIMCHAHLRPNAVIGPVCKAGGEISCSVMHSYSNKAHHGYMGHSLVGQWVNLGAATNMSNLKNTYGTVRMQLAPDELPQDTGRVFQGPIIGDMVRTAIGSRLLTGGCLGTGAMIAHSGFVPKFVPRLMFLTDAGVHPYDLEKYFLTLRRMMARRHVELAPAVEARLRALALQ